MGRGPSSVESLNTHLLCMEDLFLVNPTLGCGRDVGHGENHGGDFLVYSEQKILDKGGFFLDSRLK